VTLTEFLIARIVDDETYAWVASADHEGNEDDGRWHVEGHHDSAVVRGTGIHLPDDGGHTIAQAQHIAHHDPDRVLRECRAKRRILERAEAHQQLDTPELRYLAEVYSDHPDYRTEWLA
jgi:hypothetical protein